MEILTDGQKALELSHRQKQWAGAIAATAAQGVVFFLLHSLAGDFIAAVGILAINIGLAASFKNRNVYLTGARWATFINLSWASYVRHEYWYSNVLESFIRLRDFSNPVGWNQVLCIGSWEDILMTTVTSAMLIIFYRIIISWDEWTSRWEMLRRAPFSASLGLQAVIVTTVVYPTAFTLAAALFFASVISPIVRRQVRFNHIIFLMLVPLFALGNPTVAAFFALLAGYFFFYFVSVERSLSGRIASFSFFNGAVFLALVVSLTENVALELAPTKVGGLIALLCFIVTMAVSYLFTFRGEQTRVAIRRGQLKLTPAFVKNHGWWTPRELWVDQEVDCRRHKRYKLRGSKWDLGLFFFGPREWAEGSERYGRTDHSPLNYLPTILVLAFYSIWFLLDAVLALTNGTIAVTAGGLILGFIFVIALPLILLTREVRLGKQGNILNLLSAVFSTIIFGIFMAALLYFGLSSNQALNEQAAATTQVVTAEEDFCSCNSTEGSTLFP